ncbi:uncharacterized protein EKO05_0010660 [Ascochyta rabiei]|uniref:Uncharacterized protein n=1 Tax=Didymella rabiei TaxID=5454 RepID=A0A163AT19_DIDRA|nr:uncharacterized protein EKO05_0010660 [Ascochyta rabiei]KZM21368.1 hypothetical protein ST47_g7475 [Ascochyta rabiei]UPX20429.1 hypothetical protein EKO05_0010660 [Ascochyta rabiei]
MRSFQNVIVFLFALVACVVATTESYDTTVYLTSTVYRVNTVTMSGSPSSAVVNQTSTIYAPSASATYVASTATYVAPTATYVAPIVSYGTNSTSIKPTGSATKPTSAEFTGAASSFHANALVAALAAGVGYLVL